MTFWSPRQPVLLFSATSCVLLMIKHRTRSSGLKELLLSGSSRDGFFPSSDCSVPYCGAKMAPSYSIFRLDWLDCCYQSGVVSQTASMYLPVRPRDFFEFVPAAAQRDFAKHCTPLAVGIGHLMECPSITLSRDPEWACICLQALNSDAPTYHLQRWPQRLDLVSNL